jgi:uncharacterized membrane protein YhaH (DUF805 family)
VNLVVLVLECITKKYVTFSGRATRAEYWLFFLFYMMTIFAGAGIDYLLGTYDDDTFYFMMFFGLSLWFPLISVQVRRLHDINRSGYWWFINIVPLGGFIWFIALLLIPGNKGVNDFGSVDGNPDISKQQLLETFVRRLERLERNL